MVHGVREARQKGCHSAERMPSSKALVVETNTTAQETGQPKEASPSEEPILRLETARFAYGRRVVLDAVNFEIQAGDFWCFVGPNGEGKTTLIKGLVGALRPRLGAVRYRVDFANRTRIGFVPQASERQAFLPTTVREFVLSGLAGLALNGRTEQKRLNRALEVMGISELKQREVSKLSGGQFQRAMVARALARDPLLIVVDEPTAGLDPAAASQLLDTMTQLNTENRIPIVFVTHNLEIVRRHASHVALFRNRRVLTGPLEETFTSENLQGVFGGGLLLDEGLAGKEQA